MLSIFEFTNYREYLEAWITSRPNGGHGQKGQIATHLAISSSLVSQVIKGDKTLTSDQAAALSDYLGLADLEADYLHLLVDVDRAATERWRNRLLKKIKALQEQSRRIGQRVPRHRELTDPERAIYYSTWLYTGIRNLAACRDFNSIEDIAKHLRLEPAVIARLVRFLIEHGLCREEDGKLTYGPASIHVDRESPFVNKHHQNWRFQAIQQMERRSESDLFFTSPLSLSRTAADEIRRKVPSVIQEIMKIVGPSESEIAMCLNIDWFAY